jgi:NTE family protein
MDGQWNNVLPRPVAFVFSGGASLGSLQVGMLRALQRAGIQPDLIVGTSVGALNGAIIADRGFDRGIDDLETIWATMRRTDIFAGGSLAQLFCLLQTGQSLFRTDRLVKLIEETLPVHTFAALKLPLGVVATELSSQRSTLFTRGELQPALLASSAIPGIFPGVKINGRRHIDGCFSANVPLAAAVQMGAASLVVLDSGNRRQPGQPARGITDRLLSRVAQRLRQRLLVEAPLIAQRLPVVYLPAPALPHHSLLDFDQSIGLMAQAAAHVAHFLSTASPPSPGVMCGDLQFQWVQPVETQKAQERLVDQARPALVGV